MAALVQTIPQQTTTTTMLQARPSSSSGAFTPSSPSQQHQQSSRSQMTRSGYGGSGASGNFRGHQPAPVAPYAFTTTPGLGNPNWQGQPPHLRPESRTTSAPSLQQGLPTINSLGLNSPRTHHTAGSVSTSSSSSPSQVSKDDSAIPTRQRTREPIARPLSVNITSSFMSTLTPTPTSPAKPSPARYRTKRTDSSGAVTVNQVGASSPAVAPSPTSQNGPVFNFQPPTASSDSTRSNHTRNASADETHSEKQTELAKRYRRRSVSSMETTSFNNYIDQQFGPRSSVAKDQKPFEEPGRPRSSHAHNNSQESISSTPSNSSSKRDHDTAQSSVNSKTDAKSAHTLPRNLEIPKRAHHPSPLSKPVSMSPEQQQPSAREPASEAKPATKAQTPTPTPKVESPAAQRLTEINRKELKKPGKSRLRRAFSFGSAAELRRVSAQNNADRDGPRGDLTRKQQLDQELGAEDAAIAERQEASGLGTSIYSGQGNVFGGSTDNLSISSTASSASIMLRKMGKGMKKSTRSLVGLFRPKSLYNAPTDADTSKAQVSMVTVEAEREKVNVNVDPHSQIGGGTGFPRLERNSIEATAGTDGDSARARRSILGGDRERAEVLAAMKKGILKKSGHDSANSSPISRPVDNKGLELPLPQIPNINDSPHSSAPSTPSEDQPPRSGHRRTDSVAIEGEDYFLSVKKLGGGDSKSAPATPHSMAARNISFSPRIQFHDTWPSGEYDRRGEIATCNRLTPLLAQQIKEELNSFKMEMEVHETSKIYTHFF